MVKNWDDMELLWNYTFYEEMKCNPAEMKIMMTEPPSNPKKNREKVVKTQARAFFLNHFYQEPQS
jgi:actin-related protein